MIQRNATFWALVAMAATASIGFAEGPGNGGEGCEGGKGGGKRPKHGPPPLVGVLDADKNREISADEIAKASESLKALDKNGDNEISGEEMRPKPPGDNGGDNRGEGRQGGHKKPKGEGRGPGSGPGDRQDGPGEGGPGQGGPGEGQGKRPVPPILNALDPNHDRKIDSVELVNAPSSLRTLDKNQDGKLTPDEFMGKPPKGGRPPGGPDGPGDDQTGGPQT